jgi:hypothetical protein
VQQTLGNRQRLLNPSPPTRRQGMQSTLKDDVKMQEKKDDVLLLWVFIMGKQVLPTQYNMANRNKSIPHYKNQPDQS